MSIFFDAAYFLLFRAEIWIAKWSCRIKHRRYHFTTKTGEKKCLVCLLREFQLFKKYEKEGV